MKQQSIHQTAHTLALAPICAGYFGSLTFERNQLAIKVNVSYLIGLYTVYQIAIKP